MTSQLVYCQDLLTPVSINNVLKSSIRKSSLVLLHIITESLKLSSITFRFILMAWERLHAGLLSIKNYMPIDPREPRLVSLSLSVSLVDIA